MLFDKPRWTLEGSDRRLWVRLSANGRQCVLKAMFDTGASSCVFPHTIEKILGFDMSDGKIIKVEGVGGSIDVVVHHIDIEVLSDDMKKALLRVNGVRCFFSRDKDYRMALLGVTGFIDRFKWTLDYPGGVLTAN